MPRCKIRKDDYKPFQGKSHKYNIPTPSVYEKKNRYHMGLFQECRGDSASETLPAISALSGHRESPVVI